MDNQPNINLNVSVGTNSTEGDTNADIIDTGASDVEVPDTESSETDTSDTESSETEDDDFPSLSDNDVWV